MTDDATASNQNNVLVLDASRAQAKLVRPPP